jgi:DNA polymerase-3 subunit alpha
VPFAHLHVHSHYSLLDGTCRIEDLVEAAKEAALPALALTDHGNLFGAIEFYRAAKEAGIRPILGIEAYVARRSRLEKRDAGDNPTDHLTLLALDARGYGNLIRLASAGFLEGFYKKPRIDKETLARHAGGLVALSGCLSGEIPRRILAEDRDGAMRAAGAYEDLLGKGNFFLEAMRVGVPGEERALEGLVRLSRDGGIPLVATNDLHYRRKGDREVQDVLLCIHSGKTLADENRFRIESDALYFRTEAEMREVFRDLPAAVDRAGEIAERVTLELELGKYRIPAFETGTGESSEALFERLCREGFARRYPSPPEGASGRLQAEMATIRSMGFVPYFLIVWDIIRFARGEGIAVGPGRGSAAGSIVAYALGITDVDPLRYDLLFERFLNAERISMPDIDIDFSDVGRGRILEYVRRRYGESNVSQIVTFSTMASRAVVRDVGRVLGIPLGEVDRIAKKVPGGPGASLAEALDRDPELQEIRDSDPRYRRLLETARKLEGLARHASVHAAGVVIADRPLDTLVPLYKNKEDVTTQYSMTDLEEVGLLKMDFLGLRTLSILDRAVALARAGGEGGLDLETVPLDDPATYRLLGSGDTLGIFQLESEGMRSLLVRLRPDRFEDLVALLALYRPGPLNAGMVDTYLECKHGRRKVSYPDPRLEALLRDTHGVIVYQEQVMRIANLLAGFTLNEADNLRKAMGKKKPEILARFREKFVEGALGNGVARGRAEETWNQMETFGGYGFNKSHSTAYAVLTYRTAYLKANHRLAFTCANLTCEAADSDKIRAFVEDARRAAIRVLPPDLNRSEVGFSVEEGAIRFGLGAVKGVGDRAAETLLAARAREGRFRDLAHAAAAVDPRAINRAGFEALIKGGGFDFTGADRGALLEDLDLALGEAARERSDRVAGQGALFGDGEAEAPSAPRSPRRLPEGERLAFEREALGLYLTGHPLERHRAALRLLAADDAASLQGKGDGEEVALAGRVTELKVSVVKNGPRAGEKMARFVLEDLSGPCPTIVFPEAYGRLRERIAEEAILLARGRVDRTGETPGLRLRECERLEARLEGAEAGVVIRLTPAEVELVPRLRETLASRRGGRPVFFEILSPAGDPARVVRAGGVWGIELDAPLLEAIETLLGPGRVRLRGPEGA